jgi:hypothetical protein
LAIDFSDLNCRSYSLNVRIERGDLSVGVVLCSRGQEIQDSIPASSTRSQQIPLPSSQPTKRTGKTRKCMAWRSVLEIGLFWTFQDSVVSVCSSCSNKNHQAIKTSAYKSFQSESARRFYLFSTREPPETTADLGRDIFNEKPSKALV